MYKYDPATVHILLYNMSAYYILYLHQKSSLVAAQMTKIYIHTNAHKIHINIHTHYTPET